MLGGRAEAMLYKGRSRPAACRLSVDDVPPSVLLSKIEEQR